MARRSPSAARGFGIALVFGSLPWLASLPTCGRERAAAEAPVAAALAPQTPAGRAEPARAVDSPAFSDTARASLARDPAATPRKAGVMVQSISGKFGTLNNITRTAGSEETLCRLYLFPPLLDIDPDTLELIPLLAAARPTISADHRSYTWTLRRGVRWHRGLPDGTPVEVTSADYVFSWQMIRNEEVRAARARSSFDQIEDVKAIDATTFVVTTKEPLFRIELEFGYNFRLMPAHLAAHDPAKFNEDPLGRAPVGYGPYKFEEWKGDEYVALVRNP